MKNKKIKVEVLSHLKYFYDEKNSFIASLNVRKITDGRQKFPEVMVLKIDSYIKKSHFTKFKFL